MYQEYDPQILNELHDTYEMMIADFHDLCTRHHIPYFAIGGTLIGAVRHKGFIPWDDDVDVAMLRENYDRFLEIAEEEYSDKYYLCVPERDNTYNNFIPKFVLKNSRYISKSASSAGILDMGIFIEIFVLENVEPRKMKRQIRQSYLANILHFETVSRRRTVNGHGIAKIPKKLIKYFLFFLIKLLKITPDKTNALYLKITKSEKETGYIAYFGVWIPKNIVFNKEDLTQTKEVVFENHKICIPHNYDIFLKAYFGDYMKLPPVEERYNQGPVSISFPNGDTYNLDK